MASYVMLINWTDKGAHDFKDTVDNGKGLVGLASENGASVERIVWTLGAYDAVAMVTAPDDETAATISLAASEQGSIRTTTLRAFEQADVEAIVERAR
jgi:uncharacterized protein with GYD domain